MLRFHGHEYVTVERPAEKRSRHGDRSAFTTFTAGPCSIAWSTAWSSVNEVNKYPIEATNRDVSLFFTAEPDIKFDDRVDRKSTRLNSSHSRKSRMPSSA